MALLHRYQSTIHGNYRPVYCLFGTLTGVLMALVVWMWNIMGQHEPLTTPENYVSEVVMALGIFGTALMYRRQLPGGKVTLKELLLLGLGLGVVSGVVYGLMMWLYCGVVKPSVVEFYNQQRIAVMEPATSSAEARVAVEMVKGYTAGDWAFISGFRSVVMSIIVAFFAALLFRTEKSPVKERQKNA